VVAAVAAAADMAAAVAATVVVAAATAAAVTGDSSFAQRAESRTRVISSESPAFSFAHQGCG
jgi:hypothetical protein